MARAKQHWHVSPAFSFRSSRHSASTECGSPQTKSQMGSEPAAPSTENPQAEWSYHQAEEEHLLLLKIVGNPAKVKLASPPQCLNHSSHKGPLVTRAFHWRLPGSPAPWLSGSPADAFVGFSAIPPKRGVLSSHELGAKTLQSCLSALWTRHSRLHAGRLV